MRYVTEEQCRKKSEQSKLKVDEETEKLHNTQTEYQNRCKSLLAHGIRTGVKVFMNEVFLRGRNLS